MKLTYWLIGIMIALSGTSKSENINSDLPIYARQLDKFPIYTYPYENLASKLAAEGKTSLPLFSYGSLIDKESASRTLSPEALATRRPALAFGVKRTFDRDVPIKAGSRWNIPCNLNARGMLNIQKVENQNAFINGVLIDVPLADIPALLYREEGYNLIPVVVSNWEALQTENYHFAIAYILQAPSGSQYVNSNILPRPGYYELTRNAAMSFGPLFELVWQNTTYMADGKTPVIFWENLIHDNDPITRVWE